MSENDPKKKYPIGGKCPIWGTPACLGISAEGRTPVWSPRAGGGYEIQSSLLDDNLIVRGIKDDRQRARLTTMLIDRRMRGDDLNMQFDVVSKMFEGEEKYKERIDIYKYNRIKSDQLFFESMAWSESLEQDEVEFIIDYLKGQGFLYIKKRNAYGVSCSVSIEGYHRIE